MCTLTYYPINNNSYILASNRDELKTRAPALLPKEFTTDNIHYICPIDGEKGGTWIAVNEFGLSLCLLNWFQAYDKNTDYKNEFFHSRGEIIFNLISSNTLKECQQRLNSTPLEVYPPFRLFGFQKNPLLIKQWNWNGHQLVHQTEKIELQLWISAGREFDKVLKYRKKTFNLFISGNEGVTLDGIKALHSSEYPEKGPYAIAMTHELATTVSTTIIDTRHNAPIMHYLNGFPAGQNEWIKKKF